MLDDAAVAERLLKPICLPEPERQALILLSALHDLGKINASFRSMLVANKSRRSGRHWEVTEAGDTVCSPSVPRVRGDEPVAVLATVRKCICLMKFTDGANCGCWLSSATHR